VPFLGDIEGAMQLLGDKLHKMLPELSSITPVRCTVGVRVASLIDRQNTPKTPLIVKHSEFSNVICITGMASKGLLYHGLAGKYAVHAALSGNAENSIPPELSMASL
jgi:glycine/D-amino acid oxidase-like deaminating enzyme